ncbi:MAG: diguanylate cyclase [Gammaproteobacteria bacterium]
MVEDSKTRIIRQPSLQDFASMRQRASLVHIYPPGPEIGRRYDLSGFTEAIIGRIPECQIRIDADSVSRRHAKITHGADGWQVHDLGSTNGSYLNDVRITQHALQNGDLLKIGNTIFKFLVGDNAEAAYHEEIYRMTIIDGLTQAFNRRYFDECLRKEVIRCNRYRRPLSLVMLDVDHFKAINDSHGHVAGDRALQELARRVRANVRGIELFARYGGEEFAVMLPETPSERAMMLSERLRCVVSGKPFDLEGTSTRVTISLGVATALQETTPDALIKVADDNLYKAKRAGRNKVVA